MLFPSLSLAYLRCLKQTKCRFQGCSFQQLKFIYSKTKEWDEEVPIPAVLREVEKHWCSVFENDKKKEETACRNQQPSLGKKYVLAMFPYPSGQLHMGHMRVYTLSDAIARFYRAQGYQVIHPIGWDAFGLPAENAATEHGISPFIWTDQNIQHMKQQFMSLGYRFDWERELHTCDPQYYRWTQHLFLRLFRAQLVYKKQAFVNWDPVDETVLANEQVDSEGRAWRSGAMVQRKLLNQWYIQCTKFSKALYDGLDSPQLKDWCWRNVVAQQKKWIGRCDGYTVMMDLIWRSEAGTRPNESSCQSDRARMPVYMRQPELLHGLTFLGVRSDHELAVEGGTSPSVPLACMRVLYEKRNTNPDPPSPSTEECNFRISQASLVNPLTGANIPVIISDSLPFSPSLTEFYCGFGAASDLDKKISEACDFKVLDVLQGCTQMYIDEQNKAIIDADVNCIDDGSSISKDSLDSVIKMESSDFQAKHSTASPSLPNNSRSKDERSTTATNVSLHEKAQCSAHDPCLQNSAELTGLKCSLARAEVLRKLHERLAGGFMASSHLKDWLISRQRYWGVPIPVVHCSSCGCVPVPDADLPVLLPCHAPGASDSAFTDIHSNEAFKNCVCPQCGGAAERETDTMDTFVDSSWYFLRFLDAQNGEEIFDRALADSGMPVDLYIGGEEHAILHLYYARFMQHFLHSEGLTSHAEPFDRLLLVGRIKAPAYIRISDGKYLRPQDVDTSTQPPREKGTGAPVEVSMEKMSKSKHNGVEPSSVLAEHSIDLTRLAVLRGKTPNHSFNWQEQESIRPVIKWILLLWRTVGKFVEMRKKKASVPANVAEAEEFLRIERNVTVAMVTQCFTQNQIHSAVRRMETFARYIRSAPLETIHGDEYERCLATMLLMLAPMVPHVAAELWLAFSDHASLPQFQVGAVHELPWPQPDPGFQPPFRVFVTVNDNEIYKGVLEPEEVESMEWEASALLRYLTRQHEVVEQALGGRPALRTTLEVLKESSKAELAVYTLTPVELRRVKKERSRKKKLLRAQKIEEQSSS